MVRLGIVVIGASNNFRKMHHFPMRQQKRYPHESKNLPKWVRVKYHTMKKAGCDDLFICEFISEFHGEDIANMVRREVRKKF